MVYGDIGVVEMDLSSNELSTLSSIKDVCARWSATHQAEVGVAEMIAGAAIICAGVSSMSVVIGQDVVGSSLARIGGLAGMGIGGLTSAAVATVFLKGLFVGGVATVAGVTAVPAAVLVGGGTLIGGAFGYVAADVIEPLTGVAPSVLDILPGAGALLVGVALMIDGARRLITDPRVLKATSRFTDGVIHLASRGTGIVAATWEELKAFEINLPKNSAAIASVGGLSAIGGTVGGVLAAGSVTALGSSSLGAVALSLGIVSAPVWPVVAGAVGGAALGVVAWRSFKRRSDGKSSG
jgi:hypothetical protein